MSQSKTYLFIINPKAGARSKQNLDALIAQKAAAHQVQVKLVYTTHAGHAFEIASAVTPLQYQVVVAVGGDGTINEVGKGLINKAVALAIVPMGSGNGLARYSKIPLATAQAIDTVFSGKVMAIDVIQMNQQYSFNVSGVGFDAAVAHDFQHLKKRGFWGYFKLVLKQVFNFKPISIHIDLHTNEGVKNIKDKVFLLAVANSNQFGNNAIIAPAADAADGKFNLVLVKPFSLFLAPYYALMLFAQKFDRIGAVHNYEGAQATIKSASSQWHVDGEPVHFNTAVEIKILPLAIQLIVPQ